MTALTLTLPLPPSLNNAYPTNNGGKRFLSTEGTRWKLQAAYLIRCAATQQGFAVAEGVRLSLSMKLYFKDNRRCDISNRVKCCEDSLAESLGFDDCRIDRLDVERMPIDKDNPRCEVRLAVR